MPPPEPALSDPIHSEAFLRALIRRQLRLSIACAAAFLVGLMGLPLLNYYAPDWMARRFQGFTGTWLILGLLFFPYVWLIAWVFIRQSIALEEAEVREAQKDKDVFSSGFSASPREPEASKKTTSSRSNRGEER